MSCVSANIKCWQRSKSFSILYVASGLLKVTSQCIWHMSNHFLKGVMWGPLLWVSSSYPISATLCLMYSAAWPIPSGNMTLLFGSIPATLGGSCRGEPAEGMMADRVPRNREPAVSIRSEWFSLLHCPWMHTHMCQEEREMVQKREKTDIILFCGQRI